MRPWTDEDETVIICLHRKYRNKIICQILDRSVDAVKNRITILRKEGRLSRR